MTSFPVSVWRMGGLGCVAAISGGLCCRNCFKAFYVHKFRAMLGKNRLIFPGEKVECGVTPLRGSCTQQGSSDLWALVLCSCYPSCRQPVPATSHQPRLLSCTWALRTDPCQCGEVGKLMLEMQCPSHDVPSLPGAPGMVWGAFVQFHGLAGP